MRAGYKAGSALLAALDRTIETLLEAGGFTDAIAQVEELGAAGFTATQHFDVLNAGRVEQEDALDTNALENSADGDGFVDAAIAHRDHRSFVGLGTLFATFLNDDADANRVTDVNVGQVRL